MDEDKLFEIVRNAYNGVNTDYLKSQVLAAVAEIGLTRQEVMEGLLDWIVVGGCTGMNDRYRPYIYGALALLKEQEPRVLEYLEIEKHPLVWLEDNDKEDVIPALFLQYNGWNAEFALQAPDEYVDTIIRSPIISAVEGMYGITWRAWMAKPTNEQRKVVKWDG